LMDVSNPGAVDFPTGAKRSFNLLAFLFSPRGRINRAKIWGFSILKWGAVLALGMAAALLDTRGAPASPQDLLVGLIVVGSLYPTLVVGMKRLHDRNMSGWFWLLTFIPLANLWLWVEMYMMPGKPGDNRYGPPNDSAANRKALVETFQ